jgi:hypothetical protein
LLGCSIRNPCGLRLFVPGFDEFDGIHDGHDWRCDEHRLRRLRRFGHLHRHGWRERLDWLRRLRRQYHVGGIRHWR